MAKDLSDHARDVVQDVVRQVAKTMGDAKPDGSMLSGGRGVVAGAGLAALAPLAKKGFDAVRSNGGPSLPSPKPTKIAGKAASKVGERVGSKVKDEVGGKIDEAGGAGGIAKQAAGGLLPGGAGGMAKQAAGGLLPGGGNDDGGGSENMAGVGKGRRMPVQQSVDVAVPLETAYNQWTQFEEWPNFMHRVTRVTQDEDCSVSFASKIWGKTKEFVADIETQRPDERIQWSVSQGITHTGVVTFHELAPRLTRIELSLDVDPGSLIEKAARGMRHIKRAVRADLHRFKAYIELQEHETGAWRGVIEEGELVEEHDESYDEEREYSEPGNFFGSSDESGEDEQEEQDEEEQDEEEQDEEEAEERPRTRARSQSRRSASSRSSSGGGSGSSRSKSSGSRSSGSGSSKSSSSGRSKSRGRASSNGSGSGNSRSSGSRSKSSNGSSRSGSSSPKKKTSSRS
jgi:uncharacterized membrane protein